MSAQFIDGKAIAQRIEDDVRTRISHLNQGPTLSLVIAGHHSATEQFVAVKKRAAERVGILVQEYRAGDHASTKELKELVKNAVAQTPVGGVVVQLPLPKRVDTDAVLQEVPEHLDVDVLSEDALYAYKKGEGEFVPPVAGAVFEVLADKAVDLTDKKAVILGAGRLVGTPVAHMFTRMKIPHTVVRESTGTVPEALLEADIVVSGIGVPHYVTPSMVKPGAILIDAGTSSDGGVIKGDIDPTCAEEASLFTPTPGGIGPITVSCLLRNVVSGAEASLLNKGK